MLIENERVFFLKAAKFLFELKMMNLNTL
jgi:hypothetical protein